MELTGQIKEIIYQNEVNGYTICEIETVENEMITIVGYLPFTNMGDTLKLYGKYVVHPKYGQQFKIETFEKVIPETIEGLIHYLGSGIIKGVGPSTAKKIVDHFGEETILVLKTEAVRLSEIRGISSQKALSIAEEFTANWELFQIVRFLEKFGINANQAQKVYKEFGINAIEEIEQNPYRLLDITYGIDFRQIDKIALEMGIDITHKKRIETAIQYSLLLSSNNGHTCVLKENLITFVQELVKIETEYIEDSIIDCKVQDKIVIETRDNEEWVYLKAFYKAEQNISEKIQLLLQLENRVNVTHIDKEIKTIEKQTNIILSEKQKEAIETVNNNNISIITGGPGTGKTTIIKTILEMYQKQEYKVVLCAPTGRAAKRMTETTGAEAKTIHRLLELGKQEDDKLANVDKVITPIQADIIVIDEMSMVDVFLMNDVLKAVCEGSKLILVGDINQLSSVGPGNVLKDIIQAGVIPIVYLNKIFRQAAKSKIIVNAHRVNEGETFLTKEEAEELDIKDDFFYINETSTDKIIDNVISLCKGRLKNYNNYDFFENIQILTPTKKGNLGTKALNTCLQEMLNPYDSNKPQKTYGSQIFRIGDRVMQTKNNYDIYWEKKQNSGESGLGVFNGEMGVVAYINETEKQIKIEFDDDKQAWYSYADLEQLELAYAITIHKSQGSEFDIVIIVVSPSSPMLLTRNLLYTAITRAKEMLIMIGSNRLVERMIQNADSKKRNTGLTYKLRKGEE